MQREKESQKRINHNRALCGVALILCVFLIVPCACNTPAETPSKTESVKQPVVKPPVKNPGAPIPKSAPLTEESAQKISAEFNYDSAGKPDPFIPLINETVITSQPAGVKTAPEATDLTPLQKYDLSEFKLVAIIIRDDNNRTAMVEDKAGYGYILKKGMLIGKNNGTIREINASTVVVDEKLTDPSGNEKINTVNLSITKPEAGEK